MMNCEEGNNVKNSWESEKLSVELTRQQLVYLSVLLERDIESGERLLFEQAAILRNENVNLISEQIRKSKQILSLVDGVNYGSLEIV